MADNTGLFGDGMMGGYGNNITAANIIRARARQPIAQAAMENADTGSIRATPPTPFESWLNESGQRLMNPTDTIAQGVKDFTGQSDTELASSLLGGGGVGATVWHGSPHKFDKFDFSKIGTGEGAQAYGHGGYVADARQVATEYRDKLSGWQPGTTSMLNTHNGDLQAAIKQAESSINHYTELIKNGGGGMMERAKNFLDISHRKLADLNAMVAGQVENKGYLYKVDLPDEHIAKMLDWDKPLSQQHPDVQAALGALPSHRRILGDTLESNGKWVSGAPSGELTGREAYLLHQLQSDSQHTRGSQAMASESLRQAGIPGIKYLDATSRAQPMSASALSANKIYDDLMGSPGTSNYVVFPGNEDMLTILERNNQPLVNALRSK